jgi:hypothetical protein
MVDSIGTFFSNLSQLLKFKVLPPAAGFFLVLLLKEDYYVDTSLNILCRGGGEYEKDEIDHYWGICLYFYDKHGKPAAESSIRAFSSSVGAK